MEACYMVSYFVSNNFDSDVEDVSNCPLAAHVTFIANSLDECGFQSRSIREIYLIYNLTNEDILLCQNRRID